MLQAVSSPVIHLDILGIHHQQKFPAVAPVEVFHLNLMLSGAHDYSPLDVVVAF